MELEKFTEMIYNTFHDPKTAIIVYAKPIQYKDIYVNDENYFNYKSIQFKEKGLIKSIPATKYYSFNNLSPKKDNKESDVYRVYSVANRCGFNRIENTDFFKYDTNKLISNVKFR